MKDLNTSLNLKQEKTSSASAKTIRYERWMPVPYRHPKEFKALTSSEKDLYMYFCWHVGNRPTDEKEIEHQDYIELCTVTSWITVKQIAKELDVSPDNVKKAKLRLIELGWVRQIWFEGNDRSGIFQIGIPLAQKRSCEKSHDATYSIYNTNISSNLDSNTNSKPNAKPTRDPKKPKTPQIDPGDKRELNLLFAEAIDKKHWSRADNNLKWDWSNAWELVIPEIKTFLRAKFEATVNTNQVVEFLKTSIPKMSGKCKLAESPMWLTRTQSNGQEHAPVWGLDFIEGCWGKRHLKDPKDQTNEGFWTYLDGINKANKRKTDLNESWGGGREQAQAIDNGELPPEGLAALAALKTSLGD